MSDVSIQIRDRIVSMIGSMTISGGYNYDYDSDSINPVGGDVLSALDYATETLDDIWPVVYVIIDREESLTGGAFESNSGVIQNNLDIQIRVLFSATTDTLDTNGAKVIEDLKKLFFNDYTLKGSGSCLARWAKYQGFEIVSIQSNLDIGGVIFKLLVSYGQTKTVSTPI